MSDYITELKNIGFTFAKDVTEEEVRKAPAGLNKEAGTAYDGALGAHVILTYEIAQRLAKMVSGTFSIDANSLKKVCLLHQIAKAQMIEPNTETWAINKGILYKFKPLDGCLKVGERSVLITMNNGISLNGTEFEAMRILDREADDFKNIKFNLNIMSLILKQANELAYAIEKEKFNK